MTNHKKPIKLKEAGSTTPPYDTIAGNQVIIIQNNWNKLPKEIKQSLKDAIEKLP